MEAGGIAKVGDYYYRASSIPGIIDWIWDETYGWVPSSNGRQWRRTFTATPEELDKVVDLWPPDRPKTFITKVSS